MAWLSQLYEILTLASKDIRISGLIIVLVFAGVLRTYIKKKQNNEAYQLVAYSLSFVISVFVLYLILDKKEIVDPNTIYYRGYYEGSYVDGKFVKTSDNSWIELPRLPNSAYFFKFTVDSTVYDKVKILQLRDDVRQGTVFIDLKDRTVRWLADNGEIPDGDNKDKFCQDDPGPGKTNPPGCLEKKFRFLYEVVSIE